jgi:hypothetical protein
MDAHPIDYDVHGAVGVRLLDASAADAAAVDRQLGPIRAPLRREPDIVVRFVDRVPCSGPVRLLGLGEAGFTDDAFLLLRSRHKARARVRVDLATIGARSEIVSEHRVPAIPLLVAIVNLTALAKGLLPLHASAFVHDGTGIVATGWSKGGKTEAMLAFMQRGGRFVGDEWVHIAADGAQVHGLAEPIRLWDWHLRQLPDLRRRVGRRQLRRLDALRLAARAAGRVGAPRVTALLDRQLYADVAPGRLFDAEAVALSGRFDRLFLMGSWEEERIAVRPVDPAEVAGRMAFSLVHERAPLLAAYEQFRFAFPDRPNPLIEEAPARERALLHRLLAGRPAYAVDHPYPVRLAALFDAMSAHC